MKKKIYIAHEIGIRSHFEALYQCASEYGYNISEQIILSPRQYIRTCGRKILRERDFIGALKTFIARIHFFFMRGNILIVALAPYSELLSRYRFVYKRNKAFYMTSWPYWDGKFFPLGKAEYKNAFEYTLKNYFKGAFCVNKSAYTAMKNYFQKIALVNHSIDTSAYRRNINRSGGEAYRRYIFMGRYTDVKNVRLILKWLQVNRELKLEFTFCGQGELEREIDEYINEDSRVINIGYNKTADIQQFLCEYDFLVLPSKFEPFGIVLIEALASGVPCIVSNATGPGEVIENGSDGFVFDLSEEETGFDTVMKKSLLITDEELIMMKNNAIQTSLQYDSGNIIKRWIQLIEES